MAWIFLAEAECSQRLWNRGLVQEPFVRTTNSHKPLSYPDSTPATCRLLRSGTMYERFEGICSRSLSTLSPADSLVRTLVMRELSLAWRESEAAFSLKSSGSQLSLIPESYFSKMSLPLNRLYHKSGPSLRRLDLLAETDSYQRRHFQALKESGGFCWPRPKASWGKNGWGFTAFHLRPRNGRYSLRVVRHSLQHGKRPSVTLAEMLMGWPIGWSALNAVGTEFIRSKREKRLCA